MCGRFALFSNKNRIKQQFDAQISFDFDAHYNLGPGQEILALVGDEQKIVAKKVMWGIKPTWAGEKSKLLINARCETVHEKSSFKNAFKHNRCLFVADGWFEWIREKGQKKPFYFSRPDRRLFAFAGILVDGQGIVLTRKAPQKLSEIHDRAPLMLTRKQATVWLGSQSFSHVSENAINEFDTSIIQYYPVSAKVNSIKNDDKYLVWK